VLKNKSSLISLKAVLKNESYMILQAVLKNKLSLQGVLKSKPFMISLQAVLKVMGRYVKHRTLNRVNRKSVVM